MYTLGFVSESIKSLEEILVWEIFKIPDMRTFQASGSLSIKYAENILALQRLQTVVSHSHTDPQRSETQGYGNRTAHTL